MDKISQIEKKMEMSLDDIIKQNRANSQKGGGARGPGKPGAKAAGRAPVLLKKAQAGAAKKPAAAPKAGSRIKLGTAGGVSKTQGAGAAKRGGTGAFRQSLAKKIVGKARTMKQQQQKPAPKVLTKGSAGQRQQQAPKQLAQPKQARQKVVFNLGKNNSAKQAAPKSLAQTMNTKRRAAVAQNQRGGNGKQGGNRAPVQLSQRRRGAGGGNRSGSAPMDIDRPMQGGVRKRGQGRAPLFQGQGQGRQRQQGGGGRGPRQQQQQYAPQQQRRPAPIVYNTHLAPRVQQGGYYNPPVAYNQRRGPANPVAFAKQQAAMQALRLQQLEEERVRAERRAFMHQQMQMMEPVGRRQGGGGGMMGGGGGARAPLTAGGARGGYGGGGYGNRSGYAAWA